MPTGIFDNSAIHEFLTRLFSAPGRSNDFRALRHKLFIVATDLDSGRSVSFGTPGWDDIPIAEAVLASAALPGLFPPVEIRGRHYVDGALMMSLNASLALKEGAKLLLCVNPLVPFDADAAAKRESEPRTPLVEGGLPLVLAQTFRSVIYSRMHTGVRRYRREFPDANVVMFEPAREDAEFFFADLFSYAHRKQLAEHAYQRTRAELRRRYRELRPILARHGVAIDDEVLADSRRTLAGACRGREAHRIRHGAGPLRQLDHALTRLAGSLDERALRSASPPGASRRLRRGQR